jgi:hypothetical protein
VKYIAFICGDNYRGKDVVWNLWKSPFKEVGKIIKELGRIHFFKFFWEMRLTLGHTLDSQHQRTCHFRISHVLGCFLQFRLHFKSFLRTKQVILKVISISIRINFVNKMILIASHLTTRCYENLISKDSSSSSYNLTVIYVQR